ncbi:putative multidrug efflux pump, HlyD family protein [Calothrix sp. NIES-4071]|nr:putative multidrug efflux pump, HlyD family protein [Calothrix sp. NIES-4071]BAZ63353.1 putative multidrug efflux pump, HlyD family protein [Calothrix sp. NIES-4105]
METQQKPPTDTATRKKNKLTSITILAGTGIIITGLLTIGILPRLQRKTELDALAKSAASDVPTLNVVKPKQGKNSTELNFPGSIQANQETTIYARSSGYLRQRTVDIGDRVRPGQTLAFIDTPETDQDVQQARAELAKSE